MRSACRPQVRDASAAHISPGHRAMQTAQPSCCFGRSWASECNSTSAIALVQEAAMLDIQHSACTLHLKTAAGSPMSAVIDPCIVLTCSCCTCPAPALHTNHWIHHNLSPHRHRLVVPKYSPARTCTQEGTVGLGGAYLCIYPMNSLGGYQLVGRTLPIWNTWGRVAPSTPDMPWLLRIFDQVGYCATGQHQLSLGCLVSRTAARLHMSLLWA